MAKAESVSIADAVSELIAKQPRKTNSKHAEIIDAVTLKADALKATMQNVALAFMAWKNEPYKGRKNRAYTFCMEKGVNGIFYRGMPIDGRNPSLSYGVIVYATKNGQPIKATAEDTAKGNSDSKGLKTVRIILNDYMPQ